MVLVRVCRGALPVCLRQSYYFARYKRLVAEVKAIAAWADQQRADTGQFPRNLREYAMIRPELRPYLQYQLDPVWSDYVIRFHPTGLGNSIVHGYTHGDGFWYDDD